MFTSHSRIPLYKVSAVHMDDDWDLNAVVRGYTAAGGTIPDSSRALSSSEFQQQDCYFPCFQNPDSELQDLYKPYFPNSQMVVDLKSQHCSSLCQNHQPFSVSPTPKSSHNPNPRSKIRKNHLKKVCHVSAEKLSSDVWSWRKYGQKPIKGSPYPRGYYRCSTSKGCLARKQVERNRSDPGMFIVTYTAEHNHPAPAHRSSSLTRQKPEQAPPETSEDDEFSVSDVALDGDLFAGLGDLTADSDPAGHFPPPAVEVPWMLNSAAATTAGGG